MPFSPIDLQVSFQQAGRVADESASSEQSRERAEADQAKEDIEQRRIQENVADDADEGQEVDGESPGHAGGYHSSGGSPEEEAEDSPDSAPSTPEDPERGSFLDVTT